ncbi:hypothetical protein [Aurantiacibacter luteus]|uniref:Sulfotransferase domain-containing protein n=1 Tax=Aurantiacibacter luteus TaxID=1581420 RepID=A0A0G9MST5_9SPHN|nr:hypothetical protein [Aurantiacibacter luteus]KLE33770.1 hypothetical protein AAW00_11810 [Aurantiacibacter luteus]
MQKWRGSGRQKRSLLAADTDIVIEGFPRSANSWSVRVFAHWQRPRRLRIAHHQHSEAQVLAGVARGMPVILLLRDPADAVRSLNELDGTNLDWGLRRWIAFYRAAEQVIDKVVVATFAQATGDFGSVVKRVNERFGTEFAFGPTDDALFARITARMYDTGFPHAAREPRGAGGLPAMDPALLAAAQALYRRLAARAGAGPT